MTPRQYFFVLEYLVDLDAKDAAIRAGYSPRYAKNQASRLLARRDVAQAIRAEMAARAERTGITAERVIEEYARIAFADMRLLADWGPDGMELKPSVELSDEAAAIIALIAEVMGPEGPQLQVKTFDKRRALESLARILGVNVTAPSFGVHHA
jgi:phage terminase small subunit